MASSKDKYVINEEIFIGEWCIFSDTIKERNNDKTNVFVGMVLGFSYLQGETFKEREYSNSSVFVTHASNKGVGMLCSAYTYRSDGVLENNFEQAHKYAKIDSYIGTIEDPIYTNNVLSISPFFMF